MLITVWSPIGIRTKGRPKNRWRGEVKNYLKKLKLKNYSQLVKYIKAQNKLVQETKTDVGKYYQKSKRRRRRRNFKIGDFLFSHKWPIY